MTHSFLAFSPFEYIINAKWNPQKSTMCGNYIVGVCSKIMAQIGDPRVIMVLSQVLADLVNGEFQQMAQAKENETERFEMYLSKSFNKTGSLMTYSCEANAILSGATEEEIKAAYSYGRNIGVAFQLVDDLLDFVSSADMLGKPAAADMNASSVLPVFTTFFLRITAVVSG